MDKKTILIFCLGMIAMVGLATAGSLSGSIGGGGGGGPSDSGGDGDGGGKHGVKVNITDENYTVRAPWPDCDELNGTLCKAGQYCRGGAFGVNVSGTQLCCLNGTCASQPSCDDEIQNQCEEGVDCGSPCKPCYSDSLKILVLTRNVTDGLVFTAKVMDSNGGPVEAAKVTYGGRYVYSGEGGLATFTAEPGMNEMSAEKPDFAPAKGYVGSCPMPVEIIRKTTEYKEAQCPAYDSSLGILLGALLILSVLLNVFLLWAVFFDKTPLGGKPKARR